MARLSVAATLRDAALFAAHHLGSVIGLIWIPMVLSTVAQFFAFQRLYNDLIDVMASNNPAMMGSSLLMMLGYIVSALLLYSVMFVAVVQLALGSRSGGAIAHFAFGPLEWRLFRALMSFLGLLVTGGIAILLAGNVAVAFGPAGLNQTAIGMILVLALLGLGAALIPRFFMLLPAIAVSETAPVLRRAWALSAGNFWRLFAVWMGIVVPLFLVNVVVETIIAGPGPGITPGTPQLLLVATLVQMRQMLPVACGLSFLFSPLLIALFSGASVSAWRVLKDEPVAEVVA